MDGLSRAASACRDVLWADAELICVAIDYGDLSLTLRESTGRVRRVVCEGYIGYEMVGTWDEIVVTEAHLESVSPFLTRCIDELERRLGAHRLPSGSAARNTRMAMQLTIVLSDGCEVHVAMNGLHIGSTEEK
jgi:hypothetical protein